MARFLSWLLNGPPAPEPAAKAMPGDTSGVTFVGAPDWRQVIQLSGGSSPDAERLTRDIAFATSAYLYTALLWRAHRLGEPGLMVVRETEDGDEWMPDHPLAGTLESPRPDLDMSEMLVRTQLYRDVTGQALWTMDRALLGRRLLLTPFSGDEIRVHPVAPLVYGRYEVRTAGGAWQSKRPEEVVHFRDPQAWGWYNPPSKMDVALSLSGLGHDVHRLVRKFIQQAVFPGGVVSPDKDWHPTEEEWAVWKATVAAWAAGPAAAGKPLTVLGGTTITDGRPSLSDLLPKDVLDRVEATIGSVCGTPPVVLGWQVGLENSPWSNMGEARRQVYEDTAVPLWNDTSRRLTKAMLTPEERAAGIRIRFDTRTVLALQADLERQSRIAALNEGIWTVDERRIATGQEPLPEGDPRGAHIGPLFALSAPGTEEDPDFPEDPDEDTEEGKGSDMVWQGFHLSTKAGEPAWERAIYLHLQGELKDILAAVQKAGGDLSDAGVLQRVYQVVAENNPRLVAAVTPLLYRTGKSAVARLGARVGLSFNVLEPGLLDFVKTEGRFLADVMGKRTGDAVAKVIQEGLAAGDTIRDLIPRLRDLPEFTPARAKLVARTETTRAWNGAQKRGMEHYQREGGRQVTKEWLTARDARVRDEHQAMEGEKAPVGGTFSNGLEYPGEPNCRCTLLYHIAGDPAPVQEGQE